MRIKVNANSAATLALVICIGMSVFWLMVRALADELDPIRGVASFASSISMVLALAVAIAAMIAMMVKKPKDEKLVR